MNTLHRSTSSMANRVISALAAVTVMINCILPAKANAQETEDAPETQSLAQRERESKTASELRLQPVLYNTTDNSFISKFLQPGQYMPVSEIKPGMVGYGLTVFRGTKVEKFNVQIIGVVKKVLNGRDAILARLSGGEMGKNNVIKGMSGSPVYVNGKLIGAVSFGYDFSKEPIAGITPIVDMLDALADDQPKGRSVARLTKPAWTMTPPQSQSGGLSTVGSGGPRMVPLVSPVALVGFSPRAEQFLANKFKDVGLSVTSGSAGAPDPALAASAAAKEIQPGSAVAVLLSTGDFTTVATGTATARFGGKVVAFGHPFLQAGPIDFPMATAVVHQVLPSLSVSFKVASPMTVVGAFTADRPWACGGQIGHTSKMIPVTFNVIDEPRKIQRSYTCNVIDHPDLTPELLAATTTSAIDATHQAAGPYVAKVESRIEAEGIEPIVRSDTFSTESAPTSLSDLFGMGGDPVGRFVQRTTNRIVNNEFQKASIKSMKLNIVLEDGHKIAKIDRVYVDKAFAAPGEQVSVTAVIKPWDRQPFEQKVSFRIPRDVPDGNLLIGVGAGNGVEAMKSRLGVMDPQPENLKQIAQQIVDQGRGDQVLVMLAMPEQSLMVDGVKLVNPPAYWSKVFVSNRYTKGPSLVRGDVRTTKDVDWMLEGSHLLTVEVRSPDKTAAKQPPHPMAGATGNYSITEQARKAMSSINSRRGSGSYGGSSGGTITVGDSSSTQTNNTAASSSTSTPSSTQKPAQSAPIVVSTGKDYPHMRPVLIWRQESEEEFKNGKLDESTVDSWGRLSPGFETIATREVSPEAQIWSGCWNGSHFYYASAGDIYRWKGDNSAPERVSHIGGLLIPAMVANSKGTVYAASVPDGKVWAIDPSGKAQLLFKTPESIVTCLEVDDKDNLYAGTASIGKVYKLAAGAKQPQVISDTGQAHVLALHYSTHDGKLYVGTGERGSVYAIGPDGKSTAVYQSPDAFVTGVARDAKGDIYISTAGSGKLIRLMPSGESQTLATSEAFYKLHYNKATDSVFSGDAEGDITLACMDPVTRQPYFMPVCHTEQEGVLALASDGERLFAGTSNLARLRSFAMRYSTKPAYISGVRDAGRQANWPRLRVYGAFNEPSEFVAQRLQVETRSGETAAPDETWSKWQLAKVSGNGYEITSPAGRFFQYRLAWKPEATKTQTARGDRLTIGRIDTVYQPRDAAPQISSMSLKAGAALSGKHDLSVTSTDTDGDNMICSIDISPDGGRTWTNLKADLRAKTSKKDAKEEDKDKAEKSTDKEKGESSDKSAPEKENTTSSDDSEKSKDEAGEGKGSKGDSDSDTDEEETKEGSTDGKKNGGTKGGAEKKAEPAPKGTESDSGANKAADEKSRVLAIDESAEFERLQAKTEKSDEEDKGADKPKDGDKTEAKPADEKSDDKKADADKDKDKSNHDDKSKSAKTKSTKATGKKVKPPIKSASAGTETGSSKQSEAGTTTETFSWSWDTTKQKDGNYLVKITVDDALSNPTDHQDVINLRAVTIDNTAPEIELIDSKRLADGRLEFKVAAKDKLSPIANATYKIDDGEPFVFAQDPTTIDSTIATLIGSGVKVSSGAHKVEVKVSDRAGNTATKTINVK